MKEVTIMKRISRFIFKQWAILAIICVLSAATQVTAASNWLYGVSTNTQTINCWSQIQGSPYVEQLTSEQVAYDTQVIPKVGDIYYGRIDVYTTGNPCAGPYAHVEVALPNYTEFAIDATHPIMCYYQNISGGGSAVQVTDGGCPTQPSIGSYGSGFYSLDSLPAGSWGGGPWPLSTGMGLYILFPLRTSTPLAGMAGNYTTLVGAIQALDGNNPWDGPQIGWTGFSAPSSGPYQWVTVSDFTPIISYQTTTILTNTTAHVSGTLNHNGAKGNIYFDIGTTTSYSDSLGPAAAPNTATTPVTVDWTALTSGTTYHWRIRYVRADGVITNGADQTFTTTGAPGTPPTVYTLSISGSSFFHVDTTSSDMGAHYTLTAVIDQQGYYFKSWSIDSGAIVSTSNPYVLTMDKNHLVSVNVGFYYADLAITASATPAAIAPTDKVTYTLTVTNNGDTSVSANTTIPDVVVTDTLPLGMTYVSSSVTGTTCTETSGVVTCNLGAIAKGSSTPITIVAKPSSGLVAKTVTNKAVVSTVLAAGMDSIISNNTATVTTSIISFGVSAGVNNGVTVSALKGATNVPMAQLVTMATGTENVKIDKITVQASGTGNDALDITSVKLYLDVNDNGLVDTGDTLLASGVFVGDNGTLDLTLTSALTVTAGSPQKSLLITYNFNTTLASALPFAGFSLLFLGMVAGKRSRRWVLALALGVSVVWFNACGGGGGGGGDTVATNATLASIAISPASPAMTPGSAQQFTATGTYSDSTTKDLSTSVTWSSSNEIVATINTAGSASILSAGTTTISAELGHIIGSTVLTGTTNTTIGVTLASISVTPANPTVDIGASQQFTATGMYSDSTVKDLSSSVTWSTSNRTVATISTTGAASVASAGTTTITATSGSIVGRTALTGRTVTVPPAGSSTYKMTVTAISAKGATSGQVITVPGLPIVGSTVTVNK